MRLAIDHRSMALMKAMVSCHKTLGNSSFKDSVWLGSAELQREMGTALSHGQTQQEFAYVTI